MIFDIENNCYVIQDRSYKELIEDIDVLIEEYERDYKKEPELKSELLEFRSFFAHKKQEKWIQITEDEYKKMIKLTKQFSTLFKECKDDIGLKRFYYVILATISAELKIGFHPRTLK